MSTNFLNTLCISLNGKCVHFQGSSSASFNSPFIDDQLVKERSCSDKGTFLLRRERLCLLRVDPNWKRMFSYKEAYKITEVAEMTQIMMAVRPAILVRTCQVNWTQAPRLYIFPCSTQLSMKFFLLINVKIFTFMSWKNSILGLSEPKKSRISWF